MAPATQGQDGEWETSQRACAGRPRSGQIGQIGQIGRTGRTGGTGRTGRMAVGWRSSRVSLRTT